MAVARGLVGLHYGRVNGRSSTFYFWFSIFFFFGVFRFCSRVSLLLMRRRAETENDPFDEGKQVAKKRRHQSPTTAAARFGCSLWFLFVSKPKSEKDFFLFKFFFLNCKTKRKQEPTERWKWVSFVLGWLFFFVCCPSFLFS